MNITLASYRLGNQLGSLIAPAWIAKKALKRFLTPKRGSPKKWELAGEASGERFNLNENISAIRWMPKTSQPVRKTALLVHGWESRASQMYMFVPHILKLNYHVIAVDMPAHGQSRGEFSDAEQFTETILKVQKEIGKIDMIIGHSMGAGATCFAVSRGLEVDKLILIAAPSSVEKVIYRFTQFIGLNEKARNYFIEYCASSVGVPPKELDSSLLISSNDTPTLLIHDENDIEVPIRESLILNRIFTNSMLFKTKNMGHRKILKSPEVIEQIKNFVTE